NEIVYNCTVTNNRGNGIVALGKYIINNTMVFNNNLSGIIGNYITGSKVVNNSNNGILGGKILNYNDIYGNKPFDLKLVDSQDVDATSNWWDTTNETLIREQIYDYYDDFNLGKALYIPFLTDFAPQPTPTPTATPTPTPTPTSTPTPTPTATPSPSPTPSATPTPTPTPTPSPAPTTTQISIAVDASSAVVGTAVNVNGILSDANGNPLQDKSVTLSYAVAGNSSWVPIGSDTTNAAGEYNIQWVNTASGTFTLKAEWNGNAEYLGASSSATLSFLPYENHQDFVLESNSTVSALAFNSTSSELSFTVNGTSETAGYVKITIAKSIVANAENIKVSLDGKQLNYEVTSNANAWLLTFTYMHSTHQVRISLAANTAATADLGIEYWIAIVAVIAIVVIVAGLLVHLKKGKR
ncbi:hypothetical protein MUP38_06950, partial [Candidatus Bathyarchaeota archaeon]|nr:hypothetical protein [Candidatus Bathyarchaeota archaeon]